MTIETTIRLITLLIALFSLRFLLPKTGTWECYNDFANRDFSKDLDEKDSLVELFSSSNENEIINMRIVLDSLNIKYCILNSVFHHLNPGIYVWGYNAARILVKGKDFDLALRELSLYHSSIPKAEKGHSGKIRYIFEAIFLGWIIHDKTFRGNTFVYGEKKKVSF